MHEGKVEENRSHQGGLKGTALGTGFRGLAELIVLGLEDVGGALT